MKIYFLSFSLFLASVLASAVALTDDRCEDLAPADCKPQTVCNSGGSILVFILRRYDTQHNVIHPNDTQHNGSQYRYAECLL